VSRTTLRSWKIRLKKTFGDLKVERELSFARNSASQQSAHRNAAGSSWDIRYGENALSRDAAAYQKLLAKKRSGRTN
jgi:hypothetical protein